MWLACEFQMEGPNAIGSFDIATSALTQITGIFIVILNML